MICLVLMCMMFEYLLRQYIIEVIIRLLFVVGSCRCIAFGEYALVVILCSVGLACLDI